MPHGQQADGSGKLKLKCSPRSCRGGQATPILFSRLVCSKLPVLLAHSLVALAATLTGRARLRSSLLLLAAQSTHMEIYLLPNTETTASEKLPRQAARPHLLGAALPRLLMELELLRVFFRRLDCSLMLLEIWLSLTVTTDTVSG